MTQIVGLGNHTYLRACLSVLRQAHRGKGSRAKKPEELIPLPDLQESSVVQERTEAALFGEGCPHACLPRLILDEIYSWLVGACLYVNSLHCAGFFKQPALVSVSECWVLGTKNENRHQTRRQVLCSLRADCCS